MQRKIAKSFPSLPPPNIHVSRHVYHALVLRPLVHHSLPSTTFFRISLPSIFPYNLITSTFFFENEFQTILPTIVRVFKTRKEKKRKRSDTNFRSKSNFKRKYIDKRYIYGIRWSLRRFLCLPRRIHSYIISVHTFVTLLHNLDDASFLRFYGVAEKMKKGGSY